MKKLITALSVIGLAAASYAASVTVTIPANTITNVLTANNGNVKVTQFVLAATTSTNTAVSVYDSTSSTLTYVNPAYTNIVSYATNQTILWTNYFGVVNGWTNVMLVDVPNVVAASTNSYPVRFGAAATGGTSFRADQVNYYFYNGIWATNTSSGTAQLTITYTQ